VPFGQRFTLIVITSSSASSTKRFSDGAGPITGATASSGSMTISSSDPSEYFSIERQLSSITDECRTYKIHIYIEFIDFIVNANKFEQEVFYKKKIKNVELRNILVKYATDEEARKCFVNKTKATFEKLINSKRWNYFSGEHRTSGRNGKRLGDNFFKVGALIANYCIQNEIDIKEEFRIKKWYTKLLPEPDFKIASEIQRTFSIIDFIITKFQENDSDFKKINLEHTITSIKNELRERMLTISKNEKIKCIEVAQFEERELTFNKVYEVFDTKIEYGTLKVLIENDLGNKVFYFYRNFETIKDLRDNFIASLLD
jgi:hypothetical protein